MIAVTRGTGAVLIVVGVGGYLASDAASVTALLPALLGVAIFVLGLLAGKERLHRQAIHGALVLALLGFLGSLRNVVPLLAGDVSVRGWASLATALVTLAFVGLGVRSFVNARRAREGATS